MLLVTFLEEVVFPMSHNLSSTAASHCSKYFSIY